MKALVTGGAGFIGYHLSRRLLQEGMEVDVVDSFSRGVEDNDFRNLLKEKKTRLLKLDCNDRDAVMALSKDYDYIFHLAAIIGVRHVLERPYEVLRKNIELLLNLSDLARTQTALKRFVFASTSEIYAGTLRYFDLEIPTPETTPLALTAIDEPRTSYMLSKIYGEALLYQDIFPFTVIRPHNIYGPRMGMSHIVPEQLKKIYNSNENEEIEVYSPNHKRTFCYVSDAVEMIYKLAICNEAINQSFNIGNESPEIEIREVVKLLSEIVGKSISIKEMPVTEGSPARRCPSMKKTEDTIHYKGQVSLEEGLKMTWDWYRENVFISGGVSAK